MKKALCSLLLVGIILPLFVRPASAASYVYDLDDNSVAAPDAYMVSAVYSGYDLGVGGLDSPQDLFVARDGTVYLADTGNDRVLVFDREFRHIRTVDRIRIDGEETTLSGPEGVFADGAGLIYVCDTGNARVVAVDATNTVVRRFTNEGLMAVNQNINFRPEKVAVDTDGNVYVVDRTIYQGIVQYGADGAFINFFAPNQVEVTASVLLANLWKSIFSDEQLDSMVQNMPMPYSNVYIDRDNFLYTAAIDMDDGQQLKCLNSLGEDILQGAGSDAAGFGDLEITYNAGVEETSQFVDVHVDDDGIVCGADTMRGHLFLYNQEGSLLAVFGGTGSYQGTFKALAAVDKLGDTYLALDSEKDSLTVFKPTAYILQVREALRYYSQGMYAQAVDLWRDILHENAHFLIAYRSIGRALLQEGRYKEAMEMLEEGGDDYFYSLAFKEYRKEFVRTHFVWLLLGIIMVLVGVTFGIRRLRRWILSDEKRGRLS